MTSPLGTGARARRPLARRVAVACGGALVASALSLVTPGAATAMETDGFVLPVNGVSGDLDGTGERCDSTLAPSSPAKPVTGNGAAVAVRDSVTRTLTAPDDASDSTTFTARTSGTGRVRESGGAVRSFSFQGSASVTGVPARGAAGRCDYDANISTAFFFDGPFDRGFLRVELAQTDTLDGVVGINGAGFADAVFVAGLPGRLTYDVYLAGGDYRIDMTAEASVQRPPDAGATTNSSGRLRVVADWTRLGGALGKARGPGKRFVTLPGRRTCSAGTLTAKLRKPAGTARRVVVEVDGKRRAVAKDPRRGARVVVRGLAAGRDADVEVRVVRRNGSTATLTRDYVPCTG